MVRAYLYFNAVIYVVFAVLCTWDPVQTSQQVGYTGLTPAGMSEYLVVYGGIELGLGLFYIYCARVEQRLGILFSLALYGPIVAYRWVTLVWQWPVASTTVAIGGLETVLFVSAVLLWRRTR